ncbi:ParB/RepB/Spo0J family partition protein [Streptococcus hillyeri]|uniref:ParB/RepB/Spo0J family partition protein n=1 Tax=Streptococcus hillyeri TaxID=2282420 RepID=A0A3L9DSF1_9STRE|nr:ParB/RepB/Spo0J family partition protein [Streptococcus hillyeri]RLY03444.1 ParB/RepB/Spo0J family partition protein [Streptococcus hillyeri]
MTERLQVIKIEQIQKNPYQPRLSFNEDELIDLANSIKENGLIQPIIVRKSDVFGYELIAGERRLRASKIAGLEEIPAIIKEISDDDSMKQAIIENLQRSNLNPIEEAKAYQQMIDKKQVTHEDLARYMGKSRPYISNLLRLLNLPLSLQEAVTSGKLSQGHARVLLSLNEEKEQEFWAKEINEKQLSVRQLEAFILGKKTKKQVSKNPFITDYEKELSQQLGLPVKITASKSHKGKVTIQFSTEEDFHRIINSLK